MAIIKQGILGGFKNSVGSVVGSSWKGIATMRSKPLSVANPKTTAQVSNRNRFKSCGEFASLILASIIKPLMDRFAGQMSGYNYFTKLNKNIWTLPLMPAWADLVISKGKMAKPVLTGTQITTSDVSLDWSGTSDSRYGLPTDKVFALVVNGTTKKILFQGDTGATRNDGEKTVDFEVSQPTANNIHVYVSFLRADGSEVSDSTHFA